MSIRFGTDGIRGRAGEPPVTPAVALSVGRVAARLGPVVRVGRDTRPSSAALAHAILAGAAAAGAEAVDLGVVPTPAVAMSLDPAHGDVGVMVTASHNPAPDNGFKLFGPGGAKLDDGQARQVEAFLAEAPPPDAWGGVRDGHAEALARWEEVARRALPALPPRRVVVDLAHGAATSLIPALRRIWPGDLVVVGGGDGTVNEGVGSEHLAHLGEAVRRERADAGLAVDGDGDRCRLVDADGRPVEGDAVTWLLARGRGVRGLAVTVMSSAGLASQLPGVRVVHTPVGDKHLAAAMREHGLELGAEESGHVLFDDVPAGDGLIAGFRALALGLANGSLASALGGFVSWPRRSGTIRVGARPDLEGVPEVVDARAEGEGRLGEGGRVFLRYSGTEPVLRVLVEGRDAAVVDEVYDRVEARLRRVLA